MASGWGGRRAGSGRKPVGDSELETRGGRRRRRGADAKATGSAPARVLTHPSAPSSAQLPVVDESDCPDELTIDERKIWMGLAPHALANGTLTPATSAAFAMLCQNIFLERRLAAAPLAVGGADHRGMKALVNKQLLQFNLTACGKPMPDAAVSQPAKPVNPLDRFLKKARGS